jgi:exonuclease III
MSTDDGACKLRVFFVNTGRNASAILPKAVAAHPGLDAYCFVETMLDERSCLAAHCEGYEAHHCTRPRQAMGRPHGGITVLLSKSSPVVGTRCRKRVWADARAGILWIELPARQLTLAVCYFSPASSTLYSAGVLDEHPLGTLWHGLRSASSDRKGHQCIVLGDFNTRVGNMDSDVFTLDGAAMPPSATADAHHFISTHPGIPVQRQSMDEDVRPNIEAAMNLLHGLNAVKCVLLNGRVAGDQHGQYTYVRKATTRQPAGGGSTIDFAIVSASLYGSVEKLTVYDHSDDLSRDHCPLVLHLALQPPRSNASANAQPHIKRVVYRPVGVANTALY